MRVSNEWVRCRIFELVKVQSNKKNLKPPKAYLHSIHHHHHARGLSIEGCHLRGTLIKGSFVVSLIVMQVSLQLTYQVKVNFPKPWSQ
jgi:hypothetical protein